MVLRGCFFALLFSLAVLSNTEALAGGSCEEQFRSTAVADATAAVALATPAKSVRSARSRAARADKAKVDAATTPNAFAETPTTSAAVAPGVIKTLIDLSHLTKVDQMSAIAAERYELVDFLRDDPAQNLAVRSPFNVMSAAQRMLSLVYSQGVERRRVQVTGEEVLYYPFFSAGTPVTQGTRIVGNWKVISDLVANIESQAVGDRSGASVILLVGSAGSGKSEALKLLGRGAETLTSSTDERFAASTFFWKNLGEVPSIAKYFQIGEENGKPIYANLDAPIGDSAFVLLPTEVQNILVERASARASAMLDGRAPRPWRIADPISAFIRQEILLHEAQKRGHVLNPAEIVEALNHYVVVKRQVIGESFGKMPLIAAQGDNVDVAGLFMSSNPVMKLAYQLGPNHPLSWFINGKIMAGHGNAVLLDEVLRNPEMFRNMLLAGFESRNFATGGAPNLPADIVFIAATNSENLQALTGDGTSKAAIDRYKRTSMVWPVQPNLVGDTMLSMKGSELRMQKLVGPDESAPIEMPDWGYIFPWMEGLDRVVGPDGRVRLFYGEGQKKVEIAPHTVMMMAEIVAASRMETDPAKAAQLFNGKIVDSQLLRDPITRLRFYEGEIPNVSADEVAELLRISTLMREGEAGISSRDAGRWFSDSLKYAQDPKRGYTLTPAIARRVFDSSLDSGAIAYPDNKTRETWRSLADQVIDFILIDRLNSDISRAMASNDRIVQDAYWDLVDEMFALALNPGAKHYQSSRTGQERSVIHDRRIAVEEIYQRKFGKRLETGVIAIFHANRNGVGGTPNEQLLNAVSEYYASLHSKVASLESIVEFERTGVGSEETRASHQSMSAALNAMGYNKVAFRSALLLVEERRAMNQAPAKE